VEIVEKSKSHSSYYRNGNAPFHETESRVFGGTIQLRSTQMKYAVLIYGQEVPADQVTPEDWQQSIVEYNAYTAMLNEKGVNTNSGEALNETNTAKSIRVRDGKRNVTDGPFAETKEALGGFYIIDCKDMDEAIEYGAQCPGAKTGTVEVRPVIDFSQQQ
jgi:hypothetical protein